MEPKGSLWVAVQRELSLAECDCRYLLKDSDQCFIRQVLRRRVSRLKEVRSEDIFKEHEYDPGSMHLKGRVCF